MANGRRNVKFSHRASNGHKADGRRSSFSDVSEDGSPTKAKSSAAAAAMDQIEEVCCLLPLSYLQKPPRS